MCWNTPLTATTLIVKLSDFEKYIRTKWCAFAKLVRQLLSYEINSLLCFNLFRECLTKCKDLPEHNSVRPPAKQKYWEIYLNTKKKHDNN